LRPPREKGLDAAGLEQVIIYAVAFGLSAESDGVNGSSQNLDKILRFRDGPLDVTPFVSTSRILGASRERVHRSAVASAARAPFLLEARLIGAS